MRINAATWLTKSVIVKTRSIFQMKRAAVLLAGAATGVCAYHLYGLIKQRRNNEIEETSNKTANQNNNNELNPTKRLSIVYVIRKDLKMRSGKISAQVGHAALGIFLKVSEKYPNLTDYKFQKDLFYCHSEEEQKKIKRLAQQNKLETITIHDAGRTQIAAGSATVMAFGPIESDAVSALTVGLTPIPK